MSIQPSSSPAHAGPVNVGPSVSTSAPAVDEEGVAPSRRMELWLGVIVVLSLGTSIVGIAFVYGFNTTNLLTPQNIVPAVRATIADSLMLLGTYFSRRFLTRPQKTRWHKQWGAFWLLVALGATCFSWICNVLAVNEVGTVITVALLNKSGLGWLDVNLVNQIIAALPIVAVLIYAFVPRHPKHVQRVVDTRTPEQIREDWEREQALLQVDIQRQQLLAAQRGQGVGSIIAAARAGLFAGLGRDEAEQRTERQMADQMRVLLVKHGYKSDDQAHKMKDREVRLLAEALGLWDVASNTPTAKALGPTYAEHLAELRKEAVRRGWLTPEQIAEERDLFPPDITLRYDGIEAELSQAREEEARQAALEAEAERQRREEEARASAEVGSPGPASFPPAAPGTDTQDRPSPQASAPLATRRDGFTPQELADRLGKSRGTILGWMQLGAAGPLKIFPEEVYLDERGHRRIMPAVYLRLSRVLESQQHKGVGTRRVSRVSDPSMPAVTAETPGAEQQNGKHPETNE